MVGQTLEASFLFTNSYTSSFQTLGKVGTITKIDDDYDVTVKFGQSSFRYSPACCVPAPGATPDTVTATPGGGGEAVNCSRDEASSGKTVSRENSTFQMSLLANCQFTPAPRFPFHNSFFFMQPPVFFQTSGHTASLHALFSACLISTSSVH